MHKTTFVQKIALIFTGVFLCVILLEISLRTAGGIIILMREHRNATAFKQKGAYCIVCLGESTTALGGEESWPAQLEKVLNEKNIGVRFKVINKGREDIDTAIIASTLEDTLDKYHPDIVIVMTGINDGPRTIPYEYFALINKKLFFSRLRVYKLTKAIWLHLLNKTRELGSYKPTVKSVTAGQTSSYAAKRDIFAEKTGGGKEKEKIVPEALKSEPNNSEVYAELGHSYNKLNRYREAEEMFRKAIKIDPRNTSAYEGLGTCYNNQLRYREAEEMFRKAIKIDPRNSSTYEGLGTCYNNQLRYREAEEMFRKAIEIDPRSSGAYDGLGACYSEQLRYREAEEMFRKAIEIDPRSSGAYDGLGRCYNNQLRYREAEEMFRKAIKIDPRNSELYNELGQLYNNLNNYRQAINMFNKARDLTILGSSMENKREIHQKEDTDKEMEETYKKAIEANLLDYNKYILLGIYYREQERYPESEKIFKEAMRISPNNPKAYFELAICYMNQRRYREQEKMLIIVIRKNPSDPAPYTELGYLYSSHKRYGEAEVMFKKAVAIAPSDIDPYLALADCYREWGRLEKIEELAEMLIERDIHHDRLYGIIALSYMDYGKFKKSEIFIKKANDFRAKYYNPVTYHNYKRIKKVVTERGIKLVCMQYPLRSLEPLKKVFESTEGLIFVSNERVFKEALKKVKYEELFSDSFGGDFGHATLRGNRLIAENAANIIIKEVFGR